MRLIDADKLCEGRVNNDPVVIAAKVEPTADAVEVVRCKDCKWFTRYAELKNRETGYCSMLKPEGDGHFICWGDWYCGDGERRMEDDSN